MRWAEHVALVEERKGVYRVLVGTPEGKRPLGRPRRRWGEILKLIFKKWDEGIDWIDLTWARERWQVLVNVVVNVRVA